MPGKKGLFKLKKSSSAPNISLEWTKHDEKLLHEVEQAHKEKVETLVNKKGLNPVKLNPQGRTAFHEAAARGQKGIIQIFLDRGVDVQAADSQGRTALHLAARHGRNEVLLKLIKAGISVNSIDLCHMMPIHLACLGGHLPCVQTLISKESPLNPEDKDKRTPLFFAAEMGETAVCRELIDNGVNINAQDYGQRTALMFAAQQGHRDVADLFVKRGANVRLTDEQGLSAVHYALQGGHDDVRKILEEAPAMAAWDISADEESVVTTDEPDVAEVTDELNASLPEAERVDFIAKFTADSSSSPMVQKYERGPAIGEININDSESTSNSHESYMEIQLKQDKNDTRSSVPGTNSITERNRELEEDNEALNEEYSRIKQELMRTQNKNTELQRRLENQSSQPATIDTAVVEALEKEISDLQRQLKRSKADIGDRRTKQGLDDSWNDSDEDYSGTYDEPASRKDIGATDKQVIPMLRIQILTLQKENERLKLKVKKIPNGDLNDSSDEEEGITKLDMNILNPNPTVLSSNDITVLHSRIEELEKVNQNYAAKVRELEYSNNNYTGSSCGDESSAGIIADLKAKMEKLQVQKNTTEEQNLDLAKKIEKLTSLNNQFSKDIGRLKVEFDAASSERETFRKQLHDIATFGNSGEEGTDVLKFFSEINNLKRHNAELTVRNDQLEEEIEQMLKQRVADHAVKGVLPEDSVGQQETVLDEIVFSVDAEKVESSSGNFESPYESHWAAGVHNHKIDSLQRDNEELSQKIKELVNQKLELESGAEDLYEEITRYEGQIKELQKSYSCCKEERDVAKRKCADLEQDNQSYIEKVESLECSVQAGNVQGVEMKKLEVECEKLHDGNEAVTFVLDETKRHMEILAKENEDLKKRVEDLEQEIISQSQMLQSEAAAEQEKQRNQIDVLYKERDTYQEQIDEMERKIRKKDNRISNLVQTIEELKRGSSMLHSSKNDVEDQMGIMRREIETLKYENEELEKTVSRLMRRQSEEDSIKLSIAKSTSPQPADDAIVMQLEKEVEHLKNEVKRLEEANSEYVQEIEEFAETNQSNFEQCTQLCAELGQLKEEYTNLENQNAHFEEYCKQSEEARESLYEEYCAKKKSLREYKKECANLSAQNMELADVVGSLKEECLRLEAANEKLGQQIESREENPVIAVTDSVMYSANDDDTGLGDLNVGDGEGDVGELVQLKEECSDLQRLNSELKVRAQSVTKVQEELFELQEDNDRLSNELEKSVKEVAKLLSENQNLKEQLESGPVHDERFVTGKADLEQEVNNLQDKVTILSHEVKILKNENSVLKDDCEECKSNVQCLVDEKDELQNDKENILKLNETLRTQVEELEKENFEYANQRLNCSDCDILKSSVTVLEGEKSSLKKRVEYLEHLEIEMAQSKVDIHELRASRLKSDTKLKEIQNQNEDLRTEIVNLSKIANTRLPEEQTTDLQRALQDAEKKSKKLQDEIKRLKKQRKEFEIKHRDVVATYRSHLLSAVQGNINKEVKSALDTIQELRKS